MFANHKPDQGLTLLELVVVLSILVVLGGMAIRLVGTTRDDAQAVATDASLLAVRDAVIQYWADTKLVAFDGVATEAERFQLVWLFRNPVAGGSAPDADYKRQRIGWNGPYLMNPSGDYIVDAGRGFSTVYGDSGEATVLDAYPVLVGGVQRAGSPIVVQDVDPLGTPREIRLLSAGPNGIIDTPGNVSSDSLTSADVGDDQFLTVRLR